MKRILICLDGTWNDESNTASPAATNVARLYDSATHFKSSLQVPVYVKGVGTGIFDKIRGGVLGQGLFEQIKDAYLEIVNNYVPGSRIIIAGFSRGAFSARCLASFVATCGVLKNHTLDLGDLADKVAIDKLWELYSKRKTEAKPLLQYIENHCHPPVPGIVDAVAVWDTVGALGVPWKIFPQNVAIELFRQINELKYDFLEPVLHHHIPRAYHAVALDEQRVPFEPTLFDGPRLNDGSIQQVWFAGAHSNVGGGFANHGLSSITLDWMISQLSQHGLILRQPDEQGNPWAPVGETDMDKAAQKAEHADGGHVNLLAPRKVPADAWLHPSAQLRMQGQPGHPAIPTKAVFAGPCKIWNQPQPH